MTHVENLAVKEEPWYIIQFNIKIEHGNGPSLVNIEKFAIKDMKQQIHSHKQQNNLTFWWELLGGSSKVESFRICAHGRR